MGYSGGLRGEKLMQYEGGTRVPFIISWPGHIPADHVNCHSAISALDFLPTILTILGIKFDSKRFEGENIKDIWFGSDRSRKNPLFFKVSSNNPEVKRAMLYGKWKMHWNTRRDPDLYDITANHDEDKNIWAKYPDVGNAMLEKLIEWDRSLPSRYSRREGEKEKFFDPNKMPTIIGPPDNVDPGINNPPLHEQRCIDETDIQ